MVRGRTVTLGNIDPFRCISRSTACVLLSSLGDWTHGQAFCCFFKVSMTTLCGPAQNQISGPSIWKEYPKCRPFPACSLTRTGVADTSRHPDVPHQRFLPARPAHLPRSALLGLLSLFMVQTAGANTDSAITAPATDGAVVSGTPLVLAAAYTDDDPGEVKWAVRPGNGDCRGDNLAGNSSETSKAPPHPSHRQTQRTGRRFNTSIPGLPPGEYCFALS